MNDTVTDTELAIQNIEQQALATYTNGNLHAFKKYWNHPKIQESGTLSVYNAVAVVAGARGKRNGRMQLPGVRTAIYILREKAGLASKEIADLYGVSEALIYQNVIAEKEAMKRGAEPRKPPLKPVSQTPSAPPAPAAANWRAEVDHRLEMLASDVDRLIIGMWTTGVLVAIGTAAAVLALIAK